MNVYSSIIASKAKGKKQFALLIDPDKLFGGEEANLAEKAKKDIASIGAKELLY